MKYTILTIECGEEKVQLETNSFKLARAEYERQKQCNRGRVRINGGEILRIYQADKLFSPKNVVPCTFARRVET
jgi:hypothetical protein|nr:MAG TPA: hypothetical protein [Bacteriophage sp.]